MATLSETHPSGQRVSQVATSDPRSERTRQLVFGAVQQLMSSGAQAVSVSDIVRAAGISRSSFYTHFGGLDELATSFLRAQIAAISASGTDLLESSVSGIIAADAGETSGLEAARVGYGRLIEHMVENFPLYTSVIELPPVRHAYNDIIRRYVRGVLGAIIEQATVPAGVNAELVALYEAGGALTLISAWMRGNLDLSDEELTEQLVAFLPDWLASSRVSLPSALGVQLEETGGVGDHPQNNRKGS
ncbi:TetR/AcrR family transcriptional regulator [Lysinibacter cavernae]|uniref:AcrR family transcriptional regulator n=1 Tax=Lysinibacter cavernae TaxID=1640652 RepID=A0A7X5TT72_9MICO|nr:TetR/AcrR family transcriptional regulator [Lysinibacter cavernae]NIH53214.1 AcrR family transcriptional regulator [Lysinibacter cavernae]